MVKVKITVDTSNLNMENIPKFKEEVLEQTSKRGKQILKANTPKETGAGANAYKIIKSENQHEIRNDTRYLPWVNDGTGLFGPRHRRITPVHARVLHFHWKGREWFLKSVRGQRPQKFVEKSMPEIVEAIPEAVVIASKVL